MIEVWKDVPGYQGKYQVSNMGNVRSVNFHRQKRINILKIHKIKVKNKHRVYIKHRVTLLKDNNPKSFTLSRLVWQAFNGIIPAGYQIDHKDNNPENNRLDNLQLLTPSENTKKMYRDNPDYKSCGGYKKQKVICLNTGIIYESISDCARKLNMYDAYIRAVLKGKQKQAKGLTFNYVVDELPNNKNNLIQLELF